MRRQRRLTAAEIGEESRALVKYIDEGNTLLDAETQLAPRFNRNDWVLIQDKAVMSLRRIDGLELPDQGRSSVDGTLLSDKLAAAIGATTAGFQGQIDFQMLATLKKLWQINPDLSQYVSNIVNLGNTGHDLVVNAANDSKAEAAVNRLNEAASKLYTHGAGIDGLFNAYLAQAAWSGAISSEDVVDFAGRRVKEVVLVPVEQIRFLYLDGEYVAHQRPTAFFSGMERNPIGLIRLNPNTYHYYAIQTIENSPYALPPASASVQAIIGPQADMLDNVKFIARKLGILGLVSVGCTPPPRKPSESESEYQTRAKNYLAQVRSVLENNFNQGLMVTYRDQKVDHANVASDARGAYDIFKLNEEQIFSGMAMPPAFFGRVYSTTETFADVVWQLLVSQVGNFQRMVKRRQEQTYRLDLLLAGIDVDSVTVSFNRLHSREPHREAQSDLLRTQNVLMKAKAGIISPDQAAQELGYESAFDPELLTTASTEVATALQRIKVGAGNASQTRALFRFNRDAQSYRFIPTRLEIAGAIEVEGRDVTGNVLPGKVLSLEKKKVAA